MGGFFVAGWFASRSEQLQPSWSNRPLCVSLRFGGL